MLLSKQAASFPARLSAGMLAAGLFAAAIPAVAGTGHIAPAIAAHGVNMGEESATTPLTLTVWLNLHNRGAFDARVQALYTPGSPTYQQWLKPADLKEYAPTEAEVNAVTTELKSRGLTLVSVDPLGLSVRVQGTTANFEAALQTKIMRYAVNGNLVHVTEAQPTLGGAAAGLVAHVAGLNSALPKALNVRPKNPATGQPFAGSPVTRGGNTEGVYFASQCFYPPTTVGGPGVSAQNGVTPVSAEATGLVYGANPANTSVGTLAPCGYSPAQVQKFYGMNSAYGLGYAGAGQTIVIVDAYLQDQAETDANIFNSIYSLPQFTSSNYQVYNPYNATVPGALFGTDVETDLDVEWAHAIAPGAKIALVEAPASNDEDLQAGIAYAVENHLGNVISLSYGLPESYTGPLGLEIFNEIAEMAASEGISLNVSSGDDGDYTDYGIPADVNGWGSSPYDTVVGGTSIATTSYDNSMATIGWGTNLNFLSDQEGSTLYIYDPFNDYEFYGGSGGGASSYFAKPSYQASLPGTHRLLPDVSALADPYTGAEFVYDVSGTPYVGVIGGTSLAAPIFSGIWAVTDGYLGTNLGQAAPYMSTLPSTIIQDVVPVQGPWNVTASETDPHGTRNYSAAQLAQPLYSTTTFLSALWDEGGNDYTVVTFGTDSSLTVTPGWDDVTGWGTPNFNGVVALFPK